MILTQLETLLEIARTANVSRAAEGLHLTQPAVSGRLRALEAEVGARLFERTARGMHLTEAGRTFLPHAERAVAAIDAGVEALERLREGEVSLTVAATPPVSLTVLPEAIRQFRSEVPVARLALRTTHTDEVLQMVLGGDVDVGLTRDVRHPDIVQIPLYDEQVDLVVASDHPLARRGELEIADLAGQAFLLFDRGSSYREFMALMFPGIEIPAGDVIKLDSGDVARRMARLGLGIALLPSASVADDLAQGLLRRITVRGAAPVRLPAVAIRRRDAGGPSPTIMRFVASLRMAASAAGLLKAETPTDSGRSGFVVEGEAPS